MNEPGGNFADEPMEMVSEGVNNPSAELRKRRSTRIVQAVPLVVTGVDALGRPFVERTSSLIINCHGCRYQSKHYVLKNMWVSMEIPHAETSQPPRTVRGRVAWIQRPRTVRQLFQVALELEVSGNVWDVAFPPEDWVAFPEVPQDSTKEESAQQPPQMPPSVHETDTPEPLVETELSLGNAADNLRVFPSPASTTDASLQLARQVARLVADAKQQIQAATREGAAQRKDHTQLLESTAETLRTVCREAEETAARLKTQSDALEAHIVARAESATQALEEAAKRQAEAAFAQRETINAAAHEIQEQVAATLA